MQERHSNVSSSDCDLSPQCSVTRVTQSLTLMHLTALLLEEFRCYRHLALEIPARGLVITGANGSGKSTILEAVAFLATTRSPRAGLDREMIRWESGSGPRLRAVHARPRHGRDD